VLDDVGSMLGLGGVAPWVQPRSMVGFVFFVDCESGSVASLDAQNNSGVPWRAGVRGCVGRVWRGVSRVFVAVIAWVV